MMRNLLLLVAAVWTVESGLVITGQHEHGHGQGQGYGAGAGHGHGHGAGAGESCGDSHATCTQGDSIIRFMDVLANECAGIEPLEDSNVDLTVVIETERICQENGVSNNCLVDIYNVPRLKLIEKFMFCQGLNKLKRMNVIALRQMCPDLDDDYVESLLPPGVKEFDRGYEGCLALCGCKDETPEEGCSNMFSCAQACKIRDLGVGVDDCSAMCRRDASSGCDAVVEGFSFNLCGDCVQASGNASCVPTKQQCQRGCVIYREGNNLAAFMNIIQQTTSAGLTYYRSDKGDEATSTLLHELLDIVLQFFRQMREEQENEGEAGAR